MEAPSRSYATRFDLNQGGLGDALVARVVPRAPGARPQFDHIAGSRVLNQFPSKPSSGASAIDLHTFDTRSSIRGVAGSPTKLRQSGKKVTQEDKTSKRREQCRVNQARYRMRQQNRQLELEQGVRQLREEVERLKQGLNSPQPDRRNKYNPWTIIAEASRLLDKSFSCPWSTLQGEDVANLTVFYQEYFSPDVTMGETCGVNSLMEQAWRWSTHFDYPELQLKRIESTAPGVMKATARLAVTVTERSMSSFFPNLQQKSPKDDNVRAELVERLLGQRLQLNCSMTLLLDEESGRVAYLEHDVDFVCPLLRVLGSLEDVSSALHDQSTSTAASADGHPRSEQ